MCVLVGESRDSKYGWSFGSTLQRWAEPANVCLGHDHDLLAAAGTYFNSSRRQAPANSRPRCASASSKPAGTDSLANRREHDEGTDARIRRVEPGSLRDALHELVGSVEGSRLIP